MKTIIIITVTVLLIYFFIRTLRRMSRQEKECDHRFKYDEVVDLNINVYSLRCMRCKKTLRSLDKTGKMKFVYIGEVEGYGIEPQTLSKK